MVSLASGDSPSWLTSAFIENVICVEREREKEKKQDFPENSYVVLGNRLKEVFEISYRGTKGSNFHLEA